MLKLTRIRDVDQEYLEILIGGAEEGWIRSVGAIV